MLATFTKALFEPGAKGGMINAQVLGVKPEPNGNSDENQ
jgi:hypothetical protein